MDDEVQKTVYSLEQQHDAQGRLLREIFRNEAGQCDRGGLPSYINYDAETGKAIELVYYKNGKEHREDGPAQIIYSRTTDVIVGETWYKEGEMHRDGNLPSSISRSEDTGDIYRRSYFRCGQKVRRDVKGVEKNKLLPPEPDHI